MPGPQPVTDQICRASSGKTLERQCLALNRIRPLLPTSRAEGAVSVYRREQYQMLRAQRRRKTSYGDLPPAASMETQETQETPPPPPPPVKMDIDPAPAESAPEARRQRRRRPPPHHPRDTRLPSSDAGPPLKYPPGYGRRRHIRATKRDTGSQGGLKPTPRRPPTRVRADNAKRDLKGTRASSRVRRESKRFSRIYKRTPPKRRRRKRRQPVHEGPERGDAPSKKQKKSKEPKRIRRDDDVGRSNGGHCRDVPERRRDDVAKAAATTQPSRRMI